MLTSNNCIQNIYYSVGSLLFKKHMHALLWQETYCKFNFQDIMSKLIDVISNFSRMGHLSCWGSACRTAYFLGLPIWQLKEPKISSYTTSHHRALFSAWKPWCPILVSILISSQTFWKCKAIWLLSWLEIIVFSKDQIITVCPYFILHRHKSLLKPLKYILKKFVHFSKPRFCCINIA